MFSGEKIICGAKYRIKRHEYCTNYSLKNVGIDKDCSTSCDGLFAAGDVTDAFGKRIVIAAGEGAKATLAVKKYLMREKKKKETIAS